MRPGTKFQPVLDDPYVAVKAETERVVCLTGKLYHDLIKYRQNIGDSVHNRVAFIRIEELSPFPFTALKDTLERYPNAKEFTWIQEEPRNQGGYTHVLPRMTAVLREIGKDGDVTYVGRVEDAVPAPGISKLYKAQQESVLQGAFDG
ncbi:hypothetical protein PHLCEN_2v13106 [Hermanssonia centrifuga]|uniref:2-oxoglutarate dehydrogenase E1 component/KDG C-terminal domain-containing protein n=1 Tax=Hermanssonia centrifuga TaxID=98765 RepID=A0A2R6NG92_9APHY|nr:hypothetical protein PHLCEN_2v13106 [Hermanssonia centrifuga]